MSYEIIYDKQFIKVSENKYIPMVLGGSNNCTEFTNGIERRERNWYSIRINNDLIVSKEEMLNYANGKRTNIINENNQRERDKWFEEYDDKNFGYWFGLSIGSVGTRKTTFGQFKGIFKTGCEKALTIEELTDNGIDIVIGNSYYLGTKAKILKLSNYRKLVKTSIELEEAIKEFKEHFKGCDEIPLIYFNGMHDNKPKYLRERYFKRKSIPINAKQEIHVKSYFSIVAPNGYWFVKRTKYGYKSTSYPYLKFLTEKEAQRKLKVLGVGYKVGEVNQEHTFYK